MTFTVTGQDGTHRAILGDPPQRCCEAGHPDAESAARHAIVLASAYARCRERAA